MKAYLYALIRESTCSWHVSLDLRADRQHYLSSYGPRFRLRVMEPALSFGQAMELNRRLDLEQRSVVSLGRLRVLGVDALGLEDGRTVNWVLREWTPSGKEQCKSGAEEERRLRTMVNWLQGRQLLMDEIVALMEHAGDGVMNGEQLLYDLQLAWLAGLVDIGQGVVARRQGVIFRKKVYRCSRCGTEAKGSNNSHAEKSIRWSGCPHCQGACAYCEACLTMGRARSCSIVVSEKCSSRMLKPDSHELSHFTSPWGLSPIQSEAADEALRFMKAKLFLTSDKMVPAPPKFLIWAVTGAGKTEMIFPMIAYALALGGNIAVTTPRRDVVLELMPRIRKAFPDASVVTLYGGSEQRWEQGRITIATTHQLLRFRHAFDLVIIDEIDAFPYHNNPMLEYAAAKVCKPSGVNLLLSATPPPKLRREAALGKLPHVKVSARYHRNPLPEPRVIKSPPLRVLLRQETIPPVLMNKLRLSLDRGAQLFVFVPNISMVAPLQQLLRMKVPGVRIEGTSSKDTERADKVLAFRSRDIRLLITTTILERGVTIPQSDVFILDADSPVFDSAAMIQMAGRAGRSAQDPNGHVYFFSKEKTSSQADAIRQIRSMNRLARKKGLLLQPT